MNKLLASITGPLDYNDDILPATVPGRVLQLDGDFVAYHCTCHKDESFPEMLKAARLQIEKMRLLAGAEHVWVHLTGPGDKGGRYDEAIQKEYQATRKGRVRPEHLDQMRRVLSREYPSTLWTDQEADDGMCQGNWNAIRHGNRHLSVICSKDKDLNMCQGLHLNWDTHELFDVDGFGEIYIDDSKSSKKVVGTGNKFFWAQMLMGDTADNIQGLPKIMPEVAATVGIDIVAPKACGPVMAFSLLENIEDDQSAKNLVKDAYMAYGEAYGGFKHWKTGKPVCSSTVFLSEAILLWMRRTRWTYDIMELMEVLDGGRV